MARFPDIETLAEAGQDDVLALWAGLGYYARARNLHKAARKICSQYDGNFPATFEKIIGLPGVGRSTAGAILAFANNERYPILDGNVKRVLTRCFGIFGYPGRKEIENKLWTAAETLTPNLRVADYTQAIMDVGATLCARSRPKCGICPLQGGCTAYKQGIQRQLPQPGTKKARPVKQIRMLLIENKNRAFLLQKRPPAGVWGGLWSLPEISESNIGHQRWSRENLGLEIDSGAQLPQIDHGFTHFKLLITPLLCKLTGSSHQVMDDGCYVWYNPDSDNGIGLPAAVKKIFTDRLKKQS